MKRLLLGLMLLVTATAVSAEWTSVGASAEYIAYVDKGTIRRNGNFVKMWDMSDYKTVQTVAGDSFLSTKRQSEYDCKDEMLRDHAFTVFSGQMGSGKVVYSDSETNKWGPIAPESMGKALWKIACGKR